MTNADLDGDPVEWANMELLLKTGFILQGYPRPKHRAANNPQGQQANLYLRFICFIFYFFCTEKVIHRNQVMMPVWKELHSNIKHPRIYGWKGLKGAWLAHQAPWQGSYTSFQTSKKSCTCGRRTRLGQRPTPCQSGTCPIQSRTPPGTASSPTLVVPHGISKHVAEGPAMAQEAPVFPWPRAFGNMGIMQGEAAVGKVGRGPNL